jgi:hypothetical protein
MKPSGKISIAVATFVTLLESAAKSASAQAPVFAITPEKSFVMFSVKEASVALECVFDK